MATVYVGPTTTGTMIITNDLVWQSYNGTYTTTTTAPVITNNIVWSNLNSTYLYTTTVTNTPIPFDEPAPLNPEEEARREADRVERAAARRLADEKRDMACARAEALLAVCLNDDERECMREHGYIPVVSSRGRNFRLLCQRGHVSNVELMDEHDRRAALYCVHPGAQMPDADHWLAQKLGLEADEDQMMAVANRM